MERDYEEELRPKDILDDEEMLDEPEEEYADATPKEVEAVPPLVLEMSMSRGRFVSFLIWWSYYTSAHVSVSS